MATPSSPLIYPPIVASLVTCTYMWVRNNGPVSYESWSKNRAEKYVRLVYTLSGALPIRARAHSYTQRDRASVGSRKIVSEGGRTIMGAVELMLDLKKIKINASLKEEKNKPTA